MDGRMDKLEAQPAPFLCLPKCVGEEQNIYVFHFFMTGIIVCLTEYFKMNSGLKDYKNLFGGRNPLWYHVKWELLLGNPTTISHFTVHKQPHQLRVGNLSCNHNCQNNRLRKTVIIVTKGELSGWIISIRWLWHISQFQIFQLCFFFNIEKRHMFQCIHMCTYNSYVHIHGHIHFNSTSIHVE